MHDEFVRRLEAAGLEMFIPDEARRITNINTLKVPQGVDDIQARKRLLEKYDIDIAGGFGPLAGKIFRVGVMGPLATPENVTLLTGALIECLQ